jgi:lipoprotein signal peptidase
MQWFRASSFFLAVLVLDQGSKWWAQGNELPVYFNTGVAGGVGQYLETPLLLGAIIFSLVVMIWVFRSWWVQHPVVAGVFFGGVSSNLLDRVLFGGVRDWLPVPVLQLHNNLADWAVVGSLAFVAILTLRENKRKDQHAA